MELNGKNGSWHSQMAFVFWGHRYISPSVMILEYHLYLLYLGLCGSSPIVSKVSPTQIGDGGGAITIEGAGFSEDVFNQFDPVLGNKVVLWYL